MLWSITYEVDGEFYTTRSDYDHSWLCDISMNDLVPEIVREDEEVKQLRDFIQSVWDGLGEAGRNEHYELFKEYWGDGNDI
tara:strand:+ start:4300 stop:4542 length:243 start_codon:yes stop_codon:yes gene_type:complete